MKAPSSSVPSSPASVFSLRLIIIYWLPVVAYLGLIFYLSSLPQLVEITPFSGFDKLAHVGEYAILSWLLSRALRRASPFGQHAALIAVLFATLYGISDEFHQSFVPGRSVELLDVVCDAGGAILAQLIGSRWRGGQENSFPPYH